MLAFVCMPGPSEAFLSFETCATLQSFQKPFKRGSRGGGDCRLFLCVSAQVCVCQEIRGPDGMVWTGQTRGIFIPNQRLMTKDCVCVRESGLLIFRRSDIQYVGVYFCIWDSDDLKTGWKPNLKQELSSVHMYAHVLSSKLCRHHYPSITTVHSEDTPTAFDLQPHTHTSLRLVLNWVGLVLERLNSQLSEGAMFLAQPIQNQLAVEK